MLLDTGATLSALPADAAASLGLLPTASPGMLLGVAGLIPLSHAYAGTLEIGATRIDGQRFLELPAGKTALLGLDVLSRFDLLVVPGQRLLLRARGDLRATAAARIRRWTWLPVCASPACVRAHLEPAGRNGSLELTIEAELPRPVHLLLGCAETNAADRRLVVDLAGFKPGRVTTDVRLAASSWFSPQGAGCRQLEVLDIVPALDLTTTSSWVHAALEP